MRKINVRAWDKQKKVFSLPDLFSRAMPKNWEDFYELTEYTGLADKNCVEICEGDIIELNVPYRESQTHYGENIPHPSGEYIEQLEPEIETIRYLVKFDRGMFYIKTFGTVSGVGEELSPLAYDLFNYTSRDELMNSFYSRNWIDKDAPGEDDLGYLLEQYPPNTEKELMEYLSSCKIIGNIYENPELLEEIHD